MAAVGTAAAAAATPAAIAEDTPEVTDQATIEMGGIEMVDMGKHHFLTFYSSHIAIQIGNMGLCQSQLLMRILCS